MRHLCTSSSGTAWAGVEPGQFRTLLCHFPLTQKWNIEFRQSVGFETLTVLTMRHAVFWAATLCSLQRAWHSEKTYCSHLAWLSSPASCLLLLPSCLAYYMTLKMEAICPSETLVSLQTTQHYNSEDCTLLQLVSGGYEEIYLLGYNTAHSAENKSMKSHNHSNTPTEPTGSSVYPSPTHLKKKKILNFVPLHAFEH
jgi:hypothetical protein